MTIEKFTFWFASLLLLAGCGDAVSSPDYESPPDPEELRAHLESAIHKDDLASRHDREKGLWICRVKGDKSLFTGWAKSTRGDGAAKVFRVENGLEHGPRVTFYGDGSTMDAGWNRNGKRHGAYVFWNREGKITVRKRYGDGVELEK